MRHPAPHDTLFLHMGPGLNSFVEKHVLGQILPNVYFWDQPVANSAAGAFDFLVESAAKEIQRLQGENKAPIKILAHSFGGHLAEHLIARYPEIISSCHFLGTGYDIPGGFLNLLRTMSRAEETSSGLRSRIAAYLQKKTFNRGLKSEFWEYVQLISQDPKFMRLYWPKTSSFDSYMKIAQHAPSLDMTTFQNVLNDFLNHHFEKEFVFKGNQEIKIELGELDPVLVIDNEITAWKRRFPKAKICLKPSSGHFIHLEPYI